MKTASLYYRRDIRSKLPMPLTVNRTGGAVPGQYVRVGVQMAAAAKKQSPFGPARHSKSSYFGQGSAVAQQVFDLLLSQIIGLKREPYSEVSEGRLAEELGVSRSPVREALARLAKLELVDIYPQRGTVIAPIRVRSIKHAQFLRESLELALLRRALQSNDIAQLQKDLEAELSVQHAMQLIGDSIRFGASDESFHRRIAKSAGLSDVWGHISEAKLHIARVGRVMLISATTMPEVLAQHAEIVKAIATGNATEAEQALRSHLRRVLRLLPAAYDRHPEYFDPDEWPLVDDQWLGKN
jgi:GntR family transcriptional regulator, rspAB operon transcriptional repressor